MVFSKQTEYTVRVNGRHLLYITGAFVLAVCVVVAIILIKYFGSNDKMIAESNNLRRLSSGASGGPPPPKQQLRLVHEMHDLPKQVSFASPTDSCQQHMQDEKGVAVFYHQQCGWCKKMMQDIVNLYDKINGKVIENQNVLQTDRNIGRLYNANIKFFDVAQPTVKKYFQSQCTGDNCGVPLMQHNNQTICDGYVPINQTVSNLLNAFA